MASVDFQNIVKSYSHPKNGDTVVLNDVSFSVESGEFLVLVGPSGCGKSTLLKCLVGLQDLTDGTIRIADKVVNNLSPKDRDIALVFQSYALYPHMTVEDNMGFALKMAKRPKPEIKETVMKAAKMLDLVELLNRYPKELSGGQRQRVAIGRSIVRRPKVFLFDEPLSNLDAKLRSQLRLELKNLHKTLQTTMIYVTHDQVEAMTLADRIAVLNKGKLQQLGTPDQLFYDPDNQFVAGFIGSPSMCFLENWEDGVIVGVRPNDVVLGTGEQKATVRAVERLGFESLVYLEYQGEAITARVEGAPPTDAEVSFSFGRVYHFNPETGTRIREGRPT